MTRSPRTRSHSPVLAGRLQPIDIPEACLCSCCSAVALSAKTTSGGLFAFFGLISDDAPPHRYDCDEHDHYSDRAPWLRAAVLGANDGLVSVASIMLGVGELSS